LGEEDLYDGRGDELFALVAEYGEGERVAGLVQTSNAEEAGMDPDQNE